MRTFGYFLLLGMVGASLGALPCHAAKDDAYVIEEQGRSTWRVLFDKKMPTSAEQWEYARKTQENGWLKKADRRMLYLVRRWPNSKEAPWAARARADMLLKRGKLEAAFNAYQYLIDNYSSRMEKYDAVLQNQFDIAIKIMNKRRMRWIFGGYRAPEYAVDYFEKIISNGPQWVRAPEAQFMIGKCNQDAKDYELAIAAYAVLGYRYPDSTFAEEAAWRQVICLDILRRKFPNSPDMRERTVTASDVFLSVFPNSKYQSRIIQLRNNLYEIMAETMFDTAAFYARVPKVSKAAILYYNALMDEYPRSKVASYAPERIEVLEELMAQPVEDHTPLPIRSKPLPFGKENGDVDE